MVDPRFSVGEPHLADVAHACARPLGGVVVSDHHRQPGRRGADPRRGDGFVASHDALSRRAEAPPPRSPGRPSPVADEPSAGARTTALADTELLRAEVVMPRSDSESLRKTPQLTRVLAHRGTARARKSLSSGSDSVVLTGFVRLTEREPKCRRTTANRASRPRAVTPNRVGAGATARSRGRRAPCGAGSGTSRTGRRDRSPPRAASRSP